MKIKREFDVKLSNHFYRHDKEIEMYNVNNKRNRSNVYAMPEVFSFYLAPKKLKINTYQINSELELTKGWL